MLITAIYPANMKKLGRDRNFTPDYRSNPRVLKTRPVYKLGRAIAPWPAP